jgi:hypothetical protein
MTMLRMPKSTKRERVKRDIVRAVVDVGAMGEGVPRVWMLDGGVIFNGGEGA